MEIIVQLKGPLWASFLKIHLFIFFYPFLYELVPALFVTLDTFWPMALHYSTDHFDTVCSNAPSEVKGNG